MSLDGLGKCAAHVRVRVEGPLGIWTSSTDHTYFERFSFGVDLAAFDHITHGPGPLNLDMDVSALLPQVMLWVRGLIVHPYISKMAHVDTIKINVIDEEGKYASDVSHTFGLPTIDADLAGTGTDYVAPQLALAVTTLTGFTRGRGHEGRTFLPTPTIALTGLGQADLGVIGGVSSQAALAYAHLQTNSGQMDQASNVSLYPAVVPRSQTRVPLTSLTPKRITGVKVGQALDTIRSRRKSIPEAYTTTALVLATL